MILVLGFSPSGLAHKPAAGCLGESHAVSGQQDRVSWKVTPVRTEMFFCWKLAWEGILCVR